MHQPPECACIWRTPLVASALNNALREYDVSRSDCRSIAFDVFGGASGQRARRLTHRASPPVQHVVAHCLGERSIPISLCSLVSHGHVSSCMTETPHQFLGRCPPPGGKSGRHPSQAVKVKPLSATEATAGRQTSAPKLAEDSTPPLGPTKTRPSGAGFRESFEVIDHGREDMRRDGDLSAPRVKLRWAYIAHPACKHRRRFHDTYCPAACHRPDGSCRIVPYVRRAMRLLPPSTVTRRGAHASCDRSKRNGLLVIERVDATGL